MQNIKYEAGGCKYQVRGGVESQNSKPKAPRPKPTVVPQNLPSHPLGIHPELSDFLLKQIQALYYHSFPSKQFTKSKMVICKLKSQNFYLGKIKF